MQAVQGIVYSVGAKDVILMQLTVPPEILAVEEQQHVLQLHFNTVANKTAFILDVVFTNKKLLKEQAGIMKKLQP